MRITCPICGERDRREFIIKVMRWRLTDLEPMAVKRLGMITYTCGITRLAKPVTCGFTRRDARLGLW